MLQFFQQTADLSEAANQIGSARAWSGSTKCQTAWHWQLPGPRLSWANWRLRFVESLHPINSSWSTPATSRICLSDTISTLYNIIWQLQVVYYKFYNVVVYVSPWSRSWRACLALTGSLFPHLTTCQRPGIFRTNAEIPPLSPMLEGYKFFGWINTYINMYIVQWRTV